MSKQYKDEITAEDWLDERMKDMIIKVLENAPDEYRERATEELNKLKGKNVEAYREAILRIIDVNYW